MWTATVAYTAMAGLPNFANMIYCTAWDDKLANGMADINNARRTALEYSCKVDNRGITTGDKRPHESLAEGLMHASYTRPRDGHHTWSVEATTVYMYVVLCNVLVGKCGGESKAQVITAASG